MCDARGNICGDCPFSSKSVPGWLADYTIEDIEAFVQTESYFPCHKMMPDETLSQDQTAEHIIAGKMKLCRGFVECVIKSGKLPKYNDMLLNAMKDVKLQGLSPLSMDIREFRKHHMQLVKKDNI